MNVYDPLSRESVGTQDPRLRQTNASGPRSIPRSARVFLYMSTAFAAFSAFLNYLGPRFLNIGRSHDWPFGTVADPFRDFYLYKPRYAFFHSPEFFTFPSWPYMYPAPAAVVSKIFYSIPHSTSVFLLFMLASFLAAACLLARALVSKGVRPSAAVLYIALTAVTTTAWILDFQQGNLEVIVWLFLSLALWAFFTGHDSSAAVLIGLAASMKIYPILFLGLFLSSRRYRQAIVGIVSAAASTVFSLWLVCPDLGVSYRGIQAGLTAFRETYVLRYADNYRFDHSLFALVKVVLSGISVHLLHRDPSGHALSIALSIYLSVLTLIGTALYFTTIRRLPIVNQIICFTVAITLLPPASYDYTLLHLYAVLALLLFVSVEDSTLPGLTAAFVCLAFLLCATNQFAYHMQSISGPIKCAALFVLFCIALRYSFPSLFDESLESRGRAF